jgi:hypothetical protein
MSFSLDCVANTRVDHAEKVVRLSLYSRSSLMDLFDIWQTTVSFAATDERDKIYALLGLLKDMDSAALPPITAPRRTYNRNWRSNTCTKSMQLGS